MMPTLTAILGAARDTLRREGLGLLVSRGLPFLMRYLFQCSTVYLYEHTMRERNEADFMPRTPDFTVRIVTSNQQADELAAEGFDFRPYVFYARRVLDRGGVAFCIFVAGEFAHVGWVALTEEARGYIDPLPLRVDFSGNEACTGGTRTLARYRGMGLMTYGYFLRFEFLRKRGITVSRNTVATNNIASQRVHTKFVPRVYARARYLKILGWKFWKETPLPAEPSVPA